MTPDIYAHISGQAKQSPPDRIYGWRHTQMSIARHYGGMTVQGERYVIAGNMAIRRVIARRKKWGKWQLLDVDVWALDYAIEIYETILMASSPAQMTEAADARMALFAKQGTEFKFLEAV